MNGGRIAYSEHRLCFTINKGRAEWSFPFLLCLVCNSFIKILICFIEAYLWVMYFYISWEAAIWLFFNGLPSIIYTSQALSLLSLWCREKNESPLGQDNPSKVFWRFWIWCQVLKMPSECLKREHDVRLRKKWWTQLIWMQIAMLNFVSK